MNLTSQQKAILDAAGISVAVSAGAGCGKTFVLTQRFLGFLRPSDGRNDPLSRIVAITFTEKAAREMRHRVRVACQEELLRCEPERVPHWLGMLRGLDTARISTIHAYCATLLRTYAVEAGLDPIFGLLDSSFGDAFARRAVREALCRLLEANDAAATELVLRFGFERATALLRELLDGVRTADPSLLDGHTPESLCAAWRSCWAEECVPCLVREFWDSPAVRHVVELLQEHEPSHAAMRGRRAALLELLSREPQGEPGLVLATIREHAQVQGGGGKGAWPDESVYEEVKGAFETLRKRVGDLLDHFAAADGDGTEAAALALTAHRVARHVAEEYARRKRDEARLDFDDLLCLARDLLRDHAGVRRRAAAGIDLLMVDEFQDTDPVQADLVRYLCGDGLGTGKLFLVGDAKQSIYRFRRADPRVFAALRNELPEAGRLPLTTNFRSQPAILRFVNYVFAPEIADYEPLEPADPVQHSPEPCVEFLFCPAEDKEESAEDRRRREARWIARRLAELLADETPRVLDSQTKQLRRVKPGDVAILFRALSNVHLYEQALLEHGLDYYLAGGRAFFAQQEIHDVAHLCRWLDDPADELSLAGVLRSPLFGLTDDTLFALKPEKRSSLAAGLASPPPLPETQAEQVRRAHRILAELRAKKDRLPLADLLTLVVERTGYDAALLCEHLGPRKLANLRKLIGLARSFDAAGPFTLSEFVVRLREAVREEATEELAVTHPEVSDVLRLMTVHQAKGLEFPAVVVADMDWNRRGGDGGACYHPKLGPLFPLPDDGDGRPPHLGLLIHRLDEAREDEAELARLLYVAVTRAKDHLILSAGLEQDGKPRSPWLKLLARRFDLLTGLPALDPYLGSVGGRVRGPDELPLVHVHHSEPVPPEPGKKTRTDHAPLRRFRELVAEATPEPLPPLIGTLARDAARRSEFAVTELCEADRRANGVRSNGSSVSHEPFGLPHDGRLPFDDAPSDGQSEYARVIGSVAHAVLERLDFADAASLTEERIAQTIDRCLLSLRGEADRHLHRRVSKKVAALLSSPLANELAGATGLHREVEFRLRWDRPELGRPAEVIGTIDCLFMDADGRWHLLDYKTVEESGEDEEALVACHGLQLAAYALAVERMFGRPPATARLVRLGPPLRTSRIPVTPEALSDAARRIDAAIAMLRNG
ncbi:MAG TPA: UvrD-helicase domain-containing protein [Planctomycetaceae bacterium]